TKNQDGQLENSTHWMVGKTFIVEDVDGGAKVTMEGGEMTAEQLEEVTDELDGELDGPLEFAQLVPLDMKVGESFEVEGEELKALMGSGSDDDLQDAKITVVLKSLDESRAIFDIAMTMKGEASEGVMV